MKKKQSSDIFNYDFGWYRPKSKKIKEECCEKYKKKGEKKGEK